MSKTDNVKRADLPSVRKMVGGATGPAGTLLTSLGGWAFDTQKIFANGIELAAGAQAHIALGIPPPTSALAGTGLWLDQSGYYGLIASKQTLAFTSADGVLKAGSDLSAAATTALVVAGTAITHNGESLGAGDVLLGDNTASKANVLWDQSAGQLKFRGGTTVQAYIDTDGSIKAGAGVVRLESSGISIDSDTAGETERAYRIVEDGTPSNTLSEFRGKVYTTYQEGLLVAYPYTGKHSQARMLALSDASYNAYAALVATSYNSAYLSVIGTPSGTDPYVVASPRFMVDSGVLGNWVHRIRSVSTNDDPTEEVQQNRTTTTDATVTTLHTVTIPASTTVFIQAMVTARRTGGASGTAEDGAAYMATACVKNVAGTATLIGTATTTVVGESQAAWDATIDVTGATARVRVTGAASNNITWHVTLRTWQVGS